MFPELHYTKTTLAEVADLLILLNRVVGTEGFKDTIEMRGLAAFFMGDGGGKVADGFLAKRTLGKLDLLFVGLSISPMPRSRLAVMTHHHLFLSVYILGQILGYFADRYGEVLLVIYLFLQLGQPSRICFFCYSNQNAYPVFSS